MKKYLFYSTNDGDFGVREHHFDWTEGDTIFTDGVPCRIMKVFEGNKINIMLSNRIMKTLKKVGRIKARLGFKGGKPVIIESGYQWKSEQAKLDFIIENLAAMV